MLAGNAFGKQMVDRGRYRPNGNRQSKAIHIGSVQTDSGQGDKDPRSGCTVEFRVGPVVNHSGCARRPLLLLNIFRYDVAADVFVFFVFFFLFF